MPGDKSISHRAALLALLVSGPCRAAGWLDAEDTQRSRQAGHDLGARSRLDNGTLTIWPGVFPRHAKTDEPLVIDCGNSGTTARLLAGLLAGVRCDVLLTGDDSLLARLMGRVVVPLQRMGAEIAYLGDEGRLPLRIQGRALRAAEHVLSVASAQVKSALLLAGLAARGRTVVSGGGRCRDHTERLLAAMGAAVGRSADDAAVTLDGGQSRLGPFDIVVPGDLSSAAFFLVVAAMVPGSELTVPDVSLNPTRTGVLDVLQRAGARVFIEPDGPAVWPAEPRGDVTVAADRLRGFTVSADEVPAVIDELPVLAVLATQAEGETVVTGAAELRAKESDRIELMVTQLRRLGAEISAQPDGFAVRGPTRLATRAGGRGGGLAPVVEPADAPQSSPPPLVLKTGGDHRVAMALAVAALVTEGQTALDDPDCIAISYPAFLADLERLATARG